MRNDLKYLFIKIIEHFTKFICNIYIVLESKKKMSVQLNKK